MIALQDPQASSTADGLVAILQSLGWVDKTALGVLLVFFVLGLFKGLIWQVSRIGILVAAYFVAGRFGRDVAVMLGASESSMATSAVSGGQSANAAAGTGETIVNVPQGETTLYVAYCLLFVAVLIVLSLLAMLIKKLADRAGLSFFDRLGGGVLGVATGACVVLAGLFGINMFFPSSQLAEAATDSHALRFSQRAIGWLGEAVDDDLRSVLSLRPLGSDAPAGSLLDGRRSGDVAPDLRPNGIPWQEGQPKMPTPLPLPKGMQLEGGGAALAPASGDPASGNPASGDPASGHQETPPTAPQQPVVPREPGRGGAGRGGIR